MSFKFKAHSELKAQGEKRIKETKKVKQMKMQQQKPTPTAKGNTHPTHQLFNLVLKPGRRTTKIPFFVFVKPPYETRKRSYRSHHACLEKLTILKSSLGS